MTPLTSDEVIYQGQPSLRVGSAAYVAIYHLEGCGLAALLDRDGNDWVSYRPTGGEYGHFRGIPNMGLNAFGHPGYFMGALTTVELAREARVELRSTSRDSAWEVTWIFESQVINHVVHRVPTSYWWLYEGTPGGRFEPHKQSILLPNGTYHPCSAPYTAHANSQRGVTFIDPTTRRGLQIAAHTSEPTFDTYWPMGGDGGMTVWGFGRRDDENGVHALLQRTPAHFSIRFIESVLER